MEISTLPEASVTELRRKISIKVLMIFCTHKLQTNWYLEICSSLSVYDFDTNIAVFCGDKILPCKKNISLWRSSLVVN